MAQNISNYQLKYNDLTVGAGTPYGIRAIRGLFDMDVESGATPIPRGDGDIPGEDWVRSKDIEIEFTVEGPKQSSELQGYIEDVRLAFQRQRDPLPLWFKKPGDQEQFIRVRPIGRAIQEDVQSEFGLKPIMVRLHAADPRLYSTNTKLLTMGVHQTDSGGMDFPEDEFGMEFVPTGAGVYVAHNAGDARAYPVLRFNGPTDGNDIDGVTIYNETTGESLEVATSILVDQTLKADMSAYVRATGAQIIGLDGSSRYGDWTVPRKPFYLQPGDNVLRYEVDGTSTESVLTVTWYDTSL